MAILLNTVVLCTKMTAFTVLLKYLPLIVLCSFYEKLEIIILGFLLFCRSAIPFLLELCWHIGSFSYIIYISSFGYSIQKCLDYIEK